MRRMILLLLFAALLLSSCGKTEETVIMVQPVSFFYRTAATDFSAEDGVIRAEIRDLGAKNYTERELFELYFKGPESPDLVSPISQDTELSDVYNRGGTLVLQLTRAANSPAEFDHSLTYACLAKTGLALDGIHKVQIKVRTRGGALEKNLILSESDILLYDNGAEPSNNMEVTLFFADETGSFLLPEKRTIPMLDQQNLPGYVLELLLTSPQSGGMRMALPPGTSILDVSVDNGVCSVDFNSDFYDNRPETEQAEQLAILSVVNTLCKLDGINQVQLYAQGGKLNPYVWLDLSEPWMMDSTVIGPIRQELGEFSGTLFLPGKNDGLLHRLTVRARARGGATREEALLQALFARAPQNGLAAPLSGVSMPLSVTTTRGTCTVVMAAGSLPLDTLNREQAIRSITATLTTLQEVNAVVILEGAAILSSEALTPEADWFCAPSVQ